MMKILAVCIVYICLVPQTGISCTTFCLNQGDRTIFGRNFDWKTGNGSVFINIKGITKIAQSQSYESSKQFTWVSKFGSVTFNQLGRELPYGGMNETGLVVETMMLRDTEYPQLPDSRPKIGLFQWIQYQLDSFSTIEEVIKSDSQIRIKANLGAHFLVCDVSGKCVSIEFLKGQQVYHTKEKLPIKVLSNSKYSEALSFWKNDQIPENDTRRSIGRFTLAANMIGKYNPKKELPVDYAFKILSRVSNPSDTQWSIVYDIGKFCIYFRTKENQKIRYFFLKTIDFSSTAHFKSLDINAGFSGDITSRFID
jgi:penicillin V acylase-like amidase (Ntn superfamily)